MTEFTIIVKNTRDDNLRTFDSFEEAVEWMKRPGFVSAYRIQLVPKGYSK